MEGTATQVRSGEIITSALLRGVLDRLRVLEGATSLLLGGVGQDTHTLVAVGSGFESGGGIWLDGRSLTGEPVRGINLVVLDPTLTIKYRGTYDTADDPQSSVQLADDLLLRAAAGDIVAAVTHEVYATQLEINGKAELASIGGAALSNITDLTAAAAFIGLVPPNRNGLSFDYLVSVLPLDPTAQLVGAPFAWGLYNSRLGAFLAGQAGSRPAFGDASGIVESPPAGAPGPTIAALAATSGTIATSTSGTGTVTLDAPAPRGGLLVTLSSTSPQIAAVPGSVTIPEAQQSAPFTITAVAPGSALIIAAVSGAAPRSISVTVAQKLAIVSLSFTPPNAAPAGTVTGTVTLNAASGGGTAITLSSDTPQVAAVPGSITIPAGQTSGSFNVTTGNAGTATITASLEGSPGQTAVLAVTPILALAALALNPSSVMAGESATGTVTLTGPAPNGGASIALASTDPQVATVQSSITIVPGGSSASFTVTAGAVGNATISATLTGSPVQTAGLTVTPAPALVSLAIDSSTAVSGAQVTTTVSLNIPAPDGGTTVALSSDASQVVSVPGSVTVPAGQTSVTFSVTAGSAGTAAITASFPGSPSQQVSLIVTPVLASLGLSSSLAVAGGSVTGTVTLTGPAPAGGTAIALTSTDSKVAAVQASITILPGGSSTTFTVTAGNAGNVTITASLPGSPSQQAPLTVTPTLASLSLASSAATSGAQVSGTVALNTAAPDGGTSVTLTSNAPQIASVDGSVTVPAGQTSIAFTVTAGSAGTATITASLQGSPTQQTTLTVRAPKVGKEGAKDGVKEGKERVKELREKITDKAAAREINERIQRPAPAWPSGPYHARVDAAGESPGVQRAFIRPEERPPVGWQTLDGLGGGT